MSSAPDIQAETTREGMVRLPGGSFAMGSEAFYPEEAPVRRVKGELEDALSKLPLECLVIARPSLLAGDRARLGQPERRGEKIGMVLSEILAPLIPKNYRSVAAINVAKALLTRVPVARGREIVLSGEMQQG